MKGGRDVIFFSLFLLSEVEPDLVEERVQADVEGEVVLGARGVLDRGEPVVVAGPGEGVIPGHPHDGLPRAVPTHPDHIVVALRPLHQRHVPDRRGGNNRRGAGGPGKPCIALGPASSPVRKAHAGTDAKGAVALTASQRPGLRNVCAWGGRAHSGQLESLLVVWRTAAASD